MTTEAPLAIGTGTRTADTTGMAHDRVALITGGTRGIGAAICRELADQGAHVAAGFWHDHEAAEKFGEPWSAVTGNSPSCGGSSRRPRAEESTRLLALTY